MESTTGAMLAGKRVRGRVYVLADAISILSETATAAVTTALTIARSHGEPEFNIFRIDEEKGEVALLNYPGLGEEPFPALASTWRVHLNSELATFRTYERSLNPPILHRTELLLPLDHANHDALVTLTKVCESVGLFDDTSLIGYRRQWLSLIANKGFELRGFELVALGNLIDSDQPTSSANEDGRDDPVVMRHRTALSRSTLSAPVQALIRDDLLRSDKTFFDYGCGRGDDVTGLSKVAMAATGWDPHYFPNAPMNAAQVVNLGFVINVIENREERIQALEGAFSLSTEILSISAMLITTNPSTSGRAYADGIITSRNTFQKYYTQAELQQFIEGVLEHDAYPAGPGIFYVFKDRSAEQAYLISKRADHSRVRRARLGAFVQPRIREPRKPGPPPRTESDEATQYTTSLWSACLELGRVPALEEVPTAEIAERCFGSVRRAIAYCIGRNDPEVLQRARQGRIDDIAVMLALQFFERRRRFKEFSPRLRRDIKEFYGSLQSAESFAQQLLFSVQSPDIINVACEKAASLGLGWLENGHSLQLHTSLVEQLPAPLRVYLGCATALLGDFTSADLVKAHIATGKVTFLTFDNFIGTPLPALRTRFKVRLRDQDVDVFRYGEEFPSTILYYKSRYVNEEFPRYAEQVAFEEALECTGLFDLSGYGPTEQDFYNALGKARLQVDGFQLRQSTSSPKIDDLCGARFTYRQLLECGETWERLRIPNIPTNVATFNALHALATQVLDPVVDYFGGIKLTYGFASAALVRHIKSGIAPKIDQHASCELNREGRFVSPRLGAAVDFLVEHEDMVDVARWISENCAFDRIYIYGPDRPIHVSVGPDGAAEIYQMTTVAGKRIPRRVSL